MISLLLDNTLLYQIL